MTVLPESRTPEGVPAQESKNARASRRERAQSRGRRYLELLLPLLDERLLDEREPLPDELRLDPLPDTELRCEPLPEVELLCEPPLEVEEWWEPLLPELIEPWEPLPDELIEPPMCPPPEELPLDEPLLWC